MRQQHGSSSSSAKRFKDLLPKKAFMLEDLWGGSGGEDFDVIEVYFPVSTALLLEMQARCASWPYLRELHLVCAFNDHDVQDDVVLDLSHPGFAFPMLERLVCRNQPLRAVRLNATACPNLRIVSISYPVVPIQIFELALPLTLQELHVGYAIVCDGRGISLSTDSAVNQQLKVINKFATTVYHAGVV